MKKQSGYQDERGYQKVTLTKTGDVIRALAKDKKWSCGQTADYLISLGAKSLNLKGLHNALELR